MQDTEVLDVPTKKVGSQTNKKIEPTIQTEQKVESRFPLPYTEEEMKPHAPFDDESNFSSKVYEQKPKVAEIHNQRFKVPEKLSRVFILADGKKQGNYTIIAVEDVIDPKTGLQRRARLLRGATSIWMDEQQQFEKIKGYVEKNVLSFVFHKGRMEMPIVDKLKNQFIDVSNRNLDNPNRNGIMKEYFREWNSDKQAALQSELQDKRYEAMGIAATTNIDDFIAHAHYLGVDFIDNISGHPKTERALRTSYMEKAESDPTKFLNSIHSPVVQVSHKVRRAIDAGKIDLGKIAGQAFWVDGGFISVIPQGRNAIEYLTEFSQIPTDASRQFVYQLDNITN